MLNMKDTIQYLILSEQAECIYYRSGQIYYPPHTHATHFSVVMVLRGALHAVIQNEKTVLCENDYLVIPPDTLHEFSSERSRTLEMLTLCLSQKIYFAHDCESVMNFLTEKLSEHNFCVDHLLWQANRDINTLLHNDIASPQSEMQLLKQQILQKPESHITVSDMAENHYYSEFHLIRRFKQCVNLTPHQFLIQCRVRKAQRLLQSGYSVTDAAYASGFCDQSHLDRCFKKIVGMNPLEYVDAVTDLTQGGKKLS